MMARGMKGEKDSKFPMRREKKRDKGTVTNEGEKKGRKRDRLGREKA